mmetsp:Transcript_14363/g.32909  ORF Transcript_14363/g.32909 Transcript_14363/m.32909 type:complete len:250 (+) Transcript_14363:419-1168(+)
MPRFALAQLHKASAIEAIEEASSTLSKLERTSCRAHHRAMTSPNSPTQASTKNAPARALLVQCDHNVSSTGSGIVPTRASMRHASHAADASSTSAEDIRGIATPSRNVVTSTSSSHSHTSSGLTRRLSSTLRRRSTCECGMSRIASCTNSSHAINAVVLGGPPPRRHATSAALRRVHAPCASQARTAFVTTLAAAARAAKQALPPLLRLCTAEHNASASSASRASSRAPDFCRHVAAPATSVLAQASPT